MEIRSSEYWNYRYKTGEIQWDLDGPSTPLKIYLDHLEDKTIKILIPAGGNNHDAEYAFNSGFTNVHVIDVSEIALSAFAERCPDFPREHIHLGDFFNHEGQYDLILEQTFFCAIDYDLRQAYSDHMSKLLKPGGKLVGLWFDFPIPDTSARPPLGGSLSEYKGYFEPYFNIKTFERCVNSTTPDRQGQELFGIITKK